MYCKKCGRKLEEGLEICPFCGADIKTGKVFGEKEEKPKKEKVKKVHKMPVKKGSSLYSILGFVFALLGIVPLPLIGTILGFVLSSIGLHETRKTNANASGLGVAGLIISLICLILYACAITVIILMGLGIVPCIPGFEFRF